MSQSLDGLPPSRRRWALLTLLIAVVMTVMDGSIANVALPHIGARLHATPADSIWVVNAYQIATMVLLLPFAAAGESFGYRRISQAGMALFTLASLACALSQNLPMLVAARVVQGIGAAAVLSVNSALVRLCYPRAELGRAIGLLALAVGVSGSVAPSIASAILSVAGWPILFAINVPLGLVAVTIAGRTLPYMVPSYRAFDWFSAVLTATTLGPLALAVDAITHSLAMRAAVVALAWLALAAASAVLLVRRQSARTAPLLPMDLLRIPAFAMAIATSICAFCAQTLAFVGLPFLLQYSLHRSQVATGLLMTPWPLATGLFASIAGRFADRYPAGILAGIGMVILAAGTIGLALLPAHPGNGPVLALMAVGGVGFGFFQSPNNRAMLGAAPVNRSGGAGGMLSTARTLGQTIGAALVALSFAIAGPQARLALILAAIIATFAAAVSLSRLRVEKVGKARGSAPISPLGPPGADAPDQQLLECAHRPVRALQ